MGDTNTHYDSDPARGCGIGVLLGLLFWVIILVVIYLIRRFT